MRSQHYRVPLRELQIPSFVGGTRTWPGEVPWSRGRKKTFYSNGSAPKHAQSGTTSVGANIYSGTTLGAPAEMHLKVGSCREWPSGGRPQYDRAHRPGRCTRALLPRAARRVRTSPRSLAFPTSPPQHFSKLLRTLLGWPSVIGLVHVGWECQQGPSTNFKVSRSDLATIGCSTTTLVGIPLHLAFYGVYRAPTQPAASLDKERKVTRGRP